MKTQTLVVVMTLLAAPLLAADNPGFEKLKLLVGEWTGKATDGVAVRTVYKLIAGGSALGEYLSHGDMVTIYHLNGNELMLTHYCAAQNQPRMKAAAFKDGDRALKFSFVDATNMPDMKAMHMHNLVFTFRDANHFTQQWTLYKDGKETQTVVIELERVK